METRPLFGGIDSDSAPYAIDKGALLNSRNVRTIISQSQNSTDAQFIDGNTLITSVDNQLPSGTNTLLTKCVDNDRQIIYMFFHNSNGDHVILKYDLVTASIIFRDAYVNGGLGWTASSKLEAGATAEQLIWVDPNQDIRYLQLNFPYANHAPFDIEVITLITKPPYVPLEIARAADASVTSNIQFVPLQGMYRIKNTSNFTSVLSPFSLTALPVRQSEIDIDPNDGNTLVFTVDLAQKFPPNWKTIEFCVRFVNGNTGSVVKQYNNDVLADVVAIDAHNAGTTPLSFTWNGTTTLYQLSASELGKQQDLVPQTAEHMAFFASRLGVANAVQGYDTPVVTPGYAVVKNDYVTNQATPNIAQTYMLAARKTNGEVYIAVIIRDSNKNYLLPRDCSVGHVSSENAVGSLDNKRMLILDEDIWTVPQTVARSQLIELSVTSDPIVGTLGGIPTANPGGIQRYYIIAEANEVDFISTLDTAAVWLFTYKNVILLDDPDEVGAGGETRAFTPNSSYRLGINYYDDYLRKCGVQFLENVDIDPYGPVDLQLTESLDVTVNNTVSGAIPTFAHHYAVTLSKQQKSNRIIQYVPNIIKVALQAPDGSIKLSGYQNLVTTPLGYIVYGLAVPLASVLKYNYGYTFTEGDTVEIVGVDAAGTGDTSVIKGIVRQVVNGYVLITYDSSKLVELEKIVPESTLYVFNVGNANLTTGAGYALNWTANTVELVDNPDNQVTTPPFPPTAASILTLRAWYSVVTIFNATADFEMYEIAKFGEILNPGASATFGNFYESGSLTANILGDCYTQKRTGDTGSLTAVSITTYELQNQFPVNDTGRIAQIDRVGRNTLPTIIRYSNTNIPGTLTNGYASFDALDYVVVDETSGEITQLALTTKGVQDGGQLVILATNGSYVTLVGKQAILGSNQQEALVVTSSQVLGDINPLKGNWTCSSPKSVCVFQGRVWWVDWKNREVIEFGDGGANAVSQYKCVRLWSQILSQVTDPYQVSAGVNPYANEYMVSIPDLATQKQDLPTAYQATVIPLRPSPNWFILKDPFDCYYPTGTFIYNWDLNKWVGSWDNGNEFMNVGDRVFSWAVNQLSGRHFYEEFTGTPGRYNNINTHGIIAVPFNENYPIVKTPNAVRLSASRAPEYTWIKTDAQKFGVQVGQDLGYEMVEGDMMAQVGRNRLSENAATQQQFDNMGILGDPIKGKTVMVAFVYYAANLEFFASSASLEYVESSGH